MGVGSGLIHVRRRRKTLTFAISSSDELLLANVNYVTFAICYRNSVCLSVCLSSITLVHPPQAVEIFRNFFYRTIAQGL